MTQKETMNQEEKDIQLTPAEEEAIDRWLQRPCLTMEMQGMLKKQDKTKQ
jgi:hypothetical protein